MKGGETVPWIQASFLGGQRHKLVLANRTKAKQAYFNGTTDSTDILEIDVWKLITLVRCSQLQFHTTWRTVRGTIPILDSRCRSRRGSG